MMARARLLAFGLALLASTPLLLDAQVTPDRILRAMDRAP